MSGNGFNTVEAQGSSGAGESDQWQTATLTSTTVFNIQISGQFSTGPTLVALEVNGKLLVDTNESLYMRVNQLFGAGLIGVPNRDIEFTPGKYLFVPEQRVAPWVLYGNDPTSLIDHLRSK